MTASWMIRKPCLRSSRINFWTPPPRPPVSNAHLSLLAIFYVSVTPFLFVDRQSID